MNQEVKKHKKVWWTLNYFENFIAFVSAVSVCVSIFAFASLFRVPVGFASSAVRIKIFVITSGIKKIKSIIKKKKKKQNKIVLLAKTKLNSVKVLIYKALIYSYILIMMNSF